MKTSSTTTLQEAKNYLRKNWSKGTSCPCCGQYVRKYKRSFDSGLARFLISLYILSKGNTHAVIDKSDIRSHARIDDLKATNYGIIRFWKVAVPVETKDSEDKRTSGKWKITELGIEFALGKIKIPKYAETYNNKCVGFTGNRFDIIRALGEKFSYKELMSR